MNKRTLHIIIGIGLILIATILVITLSQKTVIKPSSLTLVPYNNQCDLAGCQAGYVSNVVCNDSAYTCTQTCTGTGCQAGAPLCELNGVVFCSPSTVCPGASTTLPPNKKTFTCTYTQYPYWELDNNTCNFVTLNLLQAGPNDYTTLGECRDHKAQVQFYYELQNNTCTQVQLTQSQVKSNDYTALSECQSNITQTSGFWSILIRFWDWLKQHFSL